MKIWIIADTHFGHKKVIEFGRPEDFEEKLMASLKVVKPDDILIHLGDVALSGEDEIWNSRIVHRSSAYMWLLLGNHDKSMAWHLKAGWDFAGRRIVIKRFGKKILFSHKPVKITEDIDLNIHGHLHDGIHRDKEFSKIITDRHLLVSMEKLDYKLITLENLIKSKK